MSSPPPLEPELLLIQSSLLPSETVHLPPPQPPASTSRLPLAEFSITSSTSPYFLTWSVPADGGTPDFQVKGTEMGREEALGWGEWMGERMGEGWEEGVETGYPIYHVLTTHFLPILQPPPPTPSPTSPTPARTISQPAHILFTSHHLLAPSKRRDLSSLSSRLHLRGVCKIGYPGLIYAQGEREEVEEFGREVRGWQWLGLRLRVLEDLEGEDLAKEEREEGEEGRRKGSWEEVGKVAEVGEWLRRIRKGELLAQCGFGGTRTDG